MMHLKYISRLSAVITVLVLISLSSAFAGNITIFDNRVDTGSSWYYMGNAPGEDQEVEPGMITNQSWDLEGFFLNGNKLSMVGGYNFQAGNIGYMSGDIFIDTTGDAKYGDDSGTTTLNGYDYVVRLNRTSGNALGNTYSVYSINTNTIGLKDVFSYNQHASSPWSYDSGIGNAQIIQDAGGTFTFSTIGTSYDGTNLLGATHYLIDGIDLSFLGHDKTFIAHFTMECGNDNLMGQGTTQAPEPGTLILLGSGLIAVAALRRKIRK